MDKPLTVKEAAEWLSITEHHLRTYLREGKLEAHKIGDGVNAQWRIWKQDLIDFVNKNGNKE